MPLTLIVRRHVQGSADDLGELRINRPFGEPMVRRLGDSKVNHLRNRLTIDLRHENIRRLDIPVNDPFQVSMLNRPTDRDEQLKSFVGTAIRITLVRALFLAYSCR